MKYWLAVLVCLGFLGPNPGFADDDFITGNDLLEYCTASSDWKIAWCHSYLIGFLSGYDTALINTVLRQAGDDPMDAELVINRIERLSSFCRPKNGNSQQMSDIVVAYLQENADMRHFWAMLLVKFALAEAFPCKE